MFEQLKQRAQQLDQQLANETTLEDNLNQAIQSTKKIESQLPANVHSQKQQLEALRQKLTQESNNLQICREKRRQELVQKSKVLSSYEKLLSMQFKACDQGVEVIFTNILASNPQQPFSFSVGIDPIAKQYVLLSCSVSVAFLPLLQELNQTNNFAKFVVCMRKKIKESVQ